MLRSIRTQILVLVMLPVGGLLAMGAFSLSRPYRVLAEAGILIPVVESVSAVGSTIHELQKERGLTSSALAANMAAEPAAALASQRKTTDEVLRRLESVFGAPGALNDGGELAKAAETVRGRVGIVRELRDSVDRGGMQPLAAVDRYSAAIEQLLHFQTLAAKASPSDSVGDMLRTYRMLVAGKEYAGIERASGAAFLNRAAADSIDLLLYSKTMGARAVQDAYLKDLALTMLPAEASIYAQQVREEVIAPFMRSRAVIEQMPTTRAPQGVTGKLWFEQSSARIDMLARVEKSFIAKATVMATEEIAQARQALIWGAVALAAAVALVAGIAFWQALGISRRVAGLAESMGRLAGGRTDIEILGIERRDEVGDMARAVGVFRDNAVALKTAESDAAENRRMSEAERAQNDKIRARDAAAQALVVETLARGLERLSEGDLTHRLNEAFAAEYEKLRTDYNAAMAQLQETIRTVAGNTESIRSGTGEISQAADDLSRRTEQQAASLEETAAALDEITATVRKTSDGATHARQVVSTAKSDAEHSGTVVRDAVAAMSEIEKSSAQISQIIGVIDEIAFQTNLLALNAGVEAARAGEAGRGFAVVASEVRALAQRSAEAAKEIKTLIQASTGHVSSGVDLVGETGKALDRIVAQVTEINGIVAEIAASAQEQSTGLAEVNTAVNQMDQVTQQNAAMVEQTTAASHSLAEQTEALAKLIGRFQIDEAEIRTPRHASLARPTMSVGAAKRSVLQRLTGRGSNLAVKRAQPSEESWEEF